MARSLQGKVVVITGGARGIGAATVEALVAEGAKVVIGDLDLATAESTGRRLGALALHVDVTDPAGFTKFLDEAESRTGPIDVLINNAGIMPLGRFEDEDDITTMRVLEINLHGVMHGTREAVKRMRPRATGHIVNIASAAGKAGFPGGATYCASKHGVVGLSEAVRMELRGSGVEMTCVMPAIVRTELAAGVKDAKMIKTVTAEQVAAAIVSALKRPRFDVFVPRAVGTTNRFARLMPRSVGEWLVRQMKGDRLFVDAAHSAERAEYESRAAASAPAADEAYGFKA
ncbi:NAD(P)-dependent dehydrogenase (short-subunit alcohol dehydrogenase family) [Kibdelosporangium banguiense]|uniref:NAD(P)-dependent dehydrogenase (Short-subunit alcohol dehydrogenase family) n=1 Tax=Kibdelosporangium banguiense TaxID=1365924 RepID=A0ABS4TF31_9PSEU|nr:SDR family oxidoreductase [Kibdelosporangium banguiense]MBP2322954.1 NAD(P)-dependent dehydrogenase (short-subunit alcohol dehydrogenase family) [Kibdelosporangium banguiense]